ncbi:MAG: XerD/XerC family integrase [Candidatus Methanohalarchaeum thermophilum]|uniref:XerD/XerC family integrase n=1 Tax=Methanohalarchaeum thermophilum TaxID=1903181 RepID=A0A1Q6DVB8_METT1|nr:MAG: XerD/XerC family integrase [Candidatus Methanohalarchaeum thermophilum]
MNKQDYKELKKSAGSTRDYLIVRLGAECGLRFFEINQIKPKQIKDSFQEVPAGKDTSGKLGGKTRSTFYPRA